MHKSFWKLQLPWTFHCLLYPEGGELEPEVSILFSGTPNTRVVFLNMEVLKVLNSSLSWENGSIKGLQGLGFKVWAMCRKSWSLILPSTKTFKVGHFEHNFFPGEWEFGRGVQVVQASTGHIVKKKSHCLCKWGSTYIFNSYSRLLWIKKRLQSNLYKLMWSPSEKRLVFVVTFQIKRVY